MTAALLDNKDGDYSRTICPVLETEQRIFDSGYCAYYISKRNKELCYIDNKAFMKSY